MKSTIPSSDRGPSFAKGPFFPISAALAICFLATLLLRAAIHALLEADPTSVLPAWILAAMPLSLSLAALVTARFFPAPAPSRCPSKALLFSAAAGLIAGGLALAFFSLLSGDGLTFVLSRMTVTNVMWMIIEIATLTAGEMLLAPYFFSRVRERIRNAALAALLAAAFAVAAEASARGAVNAWALVLAFARIAAGTLLFDRAGDPRIVAAFSLPALLLTAFDFRVEGSPVTALVFSALAVYLCFSEQGERLLARRISREEDEKRVNH